MRLASNRQMRQSQYDAVIMGCSGVSGCSLPAVKKGMALFSVFGHGSGFTPAGGRRLAFSGIVP